MKNETETKTERTSIFSGRRIQTKQEFRWHFVCEYLEFLSSVSALMKDPQFHQLYHALLNYVYEQLVLPQQGDITQFFVIVEQQTCDNQ